MPTEPLGLAIARDTLVWADLTGAIWTMPAGGDAPPKQLTEQHRDGLAFHPFVAGDRVLAKADHDLLAIALPAGPVTRVHVRGLGDMPEQAIADDRAVYLTVFKHDEIVRVPLAGGAAERVIAVPHGVLAVHGGTLYVASYRTGELLAVPAAGGTPRTLARGLARPTALAADDRAVYVYTERDQRVTRVDLGTGARATLAEHLTNSDQLVLDGDALYTVSWPDRLVRVPTTPGGGATTLADGLHQPRAVACDAHWVYVTSDAPPRIVRVPKPQ